jgi:hypothetical protein
MNEIILLVLGKLKKKKNLVYKYQLTIIEEGKLLVETIIFF